MPIESTYQQPLFILYKYIHLLLFLFPQLIHRTYQLRYMLHYFFNTYFYFTYIIRSGLLQVWVMGYCGPMGYGVEFPTKRGYYGLLLVIK